MRGEFPELLDTRAAAALLGLSARTLEERRVSGDGPAFIKLGTTKRARVRYELDQLVAWLEEQRRRSTSEHEAA